MKAERGEERREVRRTNQARIAKLIMEAGSISKGEIAARLGFSMPTTLQHIKELTEAGYITESGEYGSTGGRKAKMLHHPPLAQLHLPFSLLPAQNGAGGSPARGSHQRRRG